MQTELEKAKQHQEVDIRSELTQIGVSAVHEDQIHQEVSSTLQSAHPEANVAKDAIPPIIEPTPNLVRLPEPTGSPMKDASWGFGVMVRKLLERRRKKGELPNAA